MKIAIVSDSLGHLGFEAMLDTAASLGIEVNACNWTAAAHLDLAGMRAVAPAEASDFTLQAF